MDWTLAALEDWYSSHPGKRVAGEVRVALARMDSLRWVGNLKPAVLTVGFAHPFAKVWPHASVDEADWTDGQASLPRIKRFGRTGPGGLSGSGRGRGGATPLPSPEPDIPSRPASSETFNPWKTSLMDCRYDRILVSHLLEFADDPGMVLEKCWQALRPDGVLVVMVPNKMSLWRWKRSAPLAAGEGYGFGELHALLVEEGFRPLERGYAVACPVGGALSHRLCPNFGGLVLMTARKDVVGMRAMRRDAATGAVKAVPVGVATLKGL